METETLELLTSEVNRSIEALGNMELGSKEYGATVEDTCRLLEKANAMAKQMDEINFKREEAKLKERIRQEEVERNERIRQEELEKQERIRKEDIEIRKMEREEERNDKTAIRSEEKESNKKNRIVECAKIAVPVLTAAALVLHDDRISRMLLKFEETGTLSTSYARSFFGKILKRGK